LAVQAGFTRVELEVLGLIAPCYIQRWKHATIVYSELEVLGLIASLSAPLVYSENADLICFL
jgi:hypothetical protein